VLLHFPQSQNVTREKLPQRLLFKKGVRKMLMKLTAGELFKTNNTFGGA